ncbi:ABC transporter permease [Methylovirgula ligni]|uniref:Peptide/nickel transport system permease protein n=1 Tax=Methylovirgula ligni TaxID=569860 RepID=A0A3D9YNA5_9HYPH|nr:ABC transporter permease [Methylovirgula ligni]QAY96619.1 ABC transporter permease [Methylovirgula ligni]REF84066.1 peptide/nickel transport system permease protein [Methylovirgula ligni]
MSDVIAAGTKSAKPALLRSIGRNGSLVAGAGILAVLLTAVILAPVLYPGDPLNMVAPALMRPGESARYIFGTDDLGRDLAAEVVHGASASLLVGIGATTIGLLIGIVGGGAGGYFGGYLDQFLSRITELFQTIPSFLFVLALVGIFSPSISVIIFAIATTSWVSVARIARAEFRTLRERDFVLAARTLGYSSSRIVFVEILPNAIAPISANVSIMVAGAILTESGLSFLGMGDPNVVSWGSMIGEGRDYLRSDWYLVAIPASAIAFTVIGFNLIGDGLNRALNPRSR